jgi:hypothetical protein
MTWRTVSGRHLKWAADKRLEEGGEDAEDAAAAWTMGAKVGACDV